MTAVEEPPAIRLLRESLEEALGPTRGVSVLFEALGAWGERAPSSPSELRAVVRGPLRTALERRVGVDHAGPVLAHVEHVLLRAEAPTDVHAVLREGPEPGDRARDGDPDTGESTAPHRVLWPEEPSTARVGAVASGPVPILVLAATPTFASLLGLCLGTARADVRTARSIEAMGAAPVSSGVVVIDATDPPAIEAGRLVKVLARLPAGAVVSIFGVETTFGAALERLLEVARVTGIHVRAEDGIETIVDVVRSRYHARRDG